MGDKENALTLLQLWLSLVPREPRQFVGDQSPLNQVVVVILTDCRADPVALDPARRQAGPRRRLPRLVFFPLAFAVAFFACSNATVFSFPMATNRVRAVLRHRERKQAQRRNLRKKKENEGALFKSPVRCLL